MEGIRTRATMMEFCRSTTLPTNKTLFWTMHDFYKARLSAFIWYEIPKTNIIPFTVILTLCSLDQFVSGNHLGNQLGIIAFPAENLVVPISCYVIGVVFIVVVVVAVVVSSTTRTTTGRPTPRPRLSSRCQSYSTHLAECALGKVRMGLVRLG